MDLEKSLLLKEIEEFPKKVIKGTIPLIAGLLILIGISIDYEFLSDKDKYFSSKKQLIYERPETHYNPSIDPRGFLGIVNYNKSLEKLSEQ